jgi:hypothetical protein
MFLVSNYTFQPFFRPSSFGFFLFSILSTSSPHFIPVFFLYTTSIPHFPLFTPHFTHTHPPLPHPTAHHTTPYSSLQLHRHHPPSRHAKGNPPPHTRHPTGQPTRDPCRIPRLFHTPFRTAHQPTPHQRTASTWPAHRHFSNTAHPTRTLTTVCHLCALNRVQAWLRAVDTEH